MAINNQTSRDNQNKADKAGFSSGRQYTRSLIITKRSKYIEDVTPRYRTKPQKVAPTPVIVAKPPVISTQNLSDTKKKKRRSNRSKSQTATVIVAITLVLIGAYVSIIGWHSNRVAQVQAAKLTQQANSKTGHGQVLSTKPLTTTQVGNYVVAPNLPRYLNIPSLGVHARVFAVGLDSSGALETPNNVFDTDWYNESAQPGQPGAMLIDGHISSWTAHGVFFGLKELTQGDALQIVRGDGQVFNYKVVKSQIYSSGSVDMTAAITPIVAGKPGLNLISCTGDVVPGTSEFNQRIVVFAEQIN